jgi:hypothetical protein
VSGGLDLEQRYPRVLWLLPGYYRQRWEEDMVAAFLDSSLTGDPDEDECVLEFCRPGWQEVASVAGLAVRLYLGTAGAPRRYFAWGQAVRRAVLAVMLVHATRRITQRRGQAVSQAMRAGAASDNVCVGWNVVSAARNAESVFVAANSAEVTRWSWDVLAPPTAPGCLGPGRARRRCSQRARGCS